tara:strand:+ start:267 stop:1229 length:963 start_codon:yes stop_codon:yes gene_type:complete
MLDTTTTLADVLYPPIEPHTTGMLQVSDVHTIAWEQSGSADGIPVVVIHGGPGGGGQPSYRQYFDPAAFNIIQFDQRGCGKSTPYAELEGNNTQASVSDLEALRAHLGLEKWHVFGGSWGSTLSLIYAQHHPERVMSLVLRGIFMCRKSELHWFYQDGASHLFPDAFEPYRNHIPTEEQNDLISAYYKRLTSDDVEVRRAAAKEWTRWEMATSRLFPDPEYLEKADDLDFAVAFARIECHYFINGIFVEEGFILKRAKTIEHIPTVIVQGRYDVVCPPRSAWELHKAMPQSRLVMVPDAGHSMGEVSIARELVMATDALR